MLKTTIPYSALSLEKALIDLRNGGKIREIARRYGIPKSTLHFKKKHPDHKTTLGPSPYLSAEEESCLENWIIELSKKGFPLKKDELQLSVQKFLNDNPRPHPFKNNFPGEGWVRGFLKRHPNIAVRTSEGITYSSACLSEADIKKWFDEIRKYFIERDLMDVFNDPRRIFNGDESGFQLCPKTGKVLSQKGVKNVYSVETSSSKENMTVMFTFSAAGQSCPPMVVYNYQRIPLKVAESVPSDWGIGRSENGWMTSELFFEYIANVFHPYLIRENIPLPVIYFLDGHKTHLTYELSKLCTKLQIEVVALYPNATRILQPADVAVFRPVKAAWKTASREWLCQNEGQVITKANFAEVLNIALKKSVKTQTLINGFKACGLVPFDPNAVDYTKCVSTSKKTDSEIPAPNDDDIITYSQFVSLIGPKKETELKNCGDREKMDENFNILFDVFKSFGPRKNSNASSYITLPRTQTLTSHVGNKNDSNDMLASTLPDLTHESDPDRTPSPTILQNYDVFNDFTTLLAEQSTSNEAKQNSPIKVLQDIILTKQPGSNLSYGLCPITGIMITAAPDETPTKQLSNTVKNTHAETQPPQYLLQDSPAFKIRNSDLGPYLTLPKTPERKGKREVKRMPFAITSAKYKEMYKEQMAKKESETQKKEERKRLREEAKNKKETTKKEKLEEKPKEKNKLTSSGTNTCKICSKTTKMVNRLVCDMCSSIFHVKCVPLNHQIHVPLPEDISIDLFICHSCYREENDEEVDNDKNQYYEPMSSDEDSNMSSKENTDGSVNFLYNEYLAAKNTYN